MNAHASLHRRGQLQAKEGRWSAFNRYILVEADSQETIQCECSITEPGVSVVPISLTAQTWALLAWQASAF